MTPTITLPELEEGFNFCAGENIDLSGVFIGDPVRVEWRTIERPAGGELNLSADDTDDVIATPNVNGNYTVELCAHYTSGALSTFDITGPFVNCPYSAPIGTPVTVDVSDYGDTVAFDWTATNGTLIDDQGDSVVVQMPNSPATVLLVLMYTDIDGVTSTVTCSIVAIDAQAEMTFTESEAVCFNAIECANTCFCTTETFYVGCDQEECIDLCIDINAAQPISLIPEEICEPAVEVPLVGIASSYVPYPTITICDGCDGYEIARDPDQPNFIWNDCARCPNWSIAGEAANASDCNPGNPWCFDSFDTYTVSSSDGSECSVDVIVIYGHNIESALISASVPIFGGDRTFSISYDDAKIGGFTCPIVVPLDGLFTGSSFSFTVDGSGINGQPICIDYAMMGQKLFLPDDALPTDFVNPMDGSDFEFNVKNSECGVISRVAKQRPVTWDINIEAPDTWICKEWRSYMRYLSAGNPVLFQPSRNNKEQDILLGYISGQQQGSSYVDCGFSTVNLSVEGFINQQQPKAFSV